ncbi:DUF1236 domain-containing protein [Rhizobium sp. LCM 4573]|uniref:DUF1236 domain-containing protein n=1 Tax=Rhizobium sp. LCM 4573 TaxID=1848291 RepID=UPI0008D91D52|nr:DUF1236 domain-containing protein [Rhizobium sp. LCM 4573]OHV84314.1 hypothetical protein LCM4573_01090 [Rhizobium sp. LCM 4573]
MKTWLKCLFAASALATAAFPAWAQMTATTASDITVRSGPGEEYPEVGVATRGSPAMLDGCMQGSSWCRIDVNGMRGWVFAEYLTIEHEGTPVVVEEYRAQHEVPVVTYETTSGVAPASPAPGDLLLGPVEEVEVVEPPETVITYIEQHPAEPIYVRNELAIGATIPPGVTIQEVPDYDYSYVVVNDRRVLVDPATRRIVHIYD